MCTANIRIIDRSEDLPEMKSYNFFHSPELFRIIEQTPVNYPYMVIATDDKGEVIAHMFATLRRRGSWLPPYLYTQSRVYGEGEYEDLNHKEELFGMMLKALTQSLNTRTLYIEVSHLSQKMLGYRQLRQLGYFPVNWMSIHNSLHSHAPEERISEKLQRRIDSAHARGVKTEVVSTEEDFKAFSKLLRRHNILKPKRFIPDDIFFRQIMDGEEGRLFVTKYHGRVIGCSACAYSQGNAYLWYSAFRRKTYMHLHPDVVTIWDTMKDAYDRGYQHMCFMDVGLPFSRNPFREFILRFGGKEQSTYRWFRCSIRWVNKLLAWIYRE